jgi:hypothetical protein
VLSSEKQNAIELVDNKNSTRQQLAEVEYELHAHQQANTVLEQQLEAQRLQASKHEQLLGQARSHLDTEFERQANRETEWLSVQEELARLRPLEEAYRAEQERSRALEEEKMQLTQRLSGVTMDVWSARQEQGESQLESQQRLTAEISRVRIEVWQRGLD